MGLESGEFARRQTAPLSGGQAAQPERTELNAAETLHGMTNGLTDPPDFAVPPFSQREREDTPASIAAEHLNAQRHGQAVLQHHSTAHALECGVTHASRDLSLIHPLALEPRVKEAMGKLPIVGEEQ
jgi:hypothetical protein